MGEPTISEEAVEALGRYEFMASDCGDRKVLKLTAQEAAEVALTAAEPLMHEELRATVARLREALGSCAGFISGCRDDYSPGEWRESQAHRLCLEIAAALAPSDEDEDRV